METSEEPREPSKVPDQDSTSKSTSQTTHPFSIQTKQFEAVFGGVTVYFQLIKLQRSCFLWIGDKRKCLDNLSVAMPNPFENAPLLTQILDRSPADSLIVRDEGQRIAAKLSKKMNAQVFVSFAVDAPSEMDVVGSVEKYLFELLKGGEEFVLPSDQHLMK